MGAAVNISAVPRQMFLFFGAFCLIFAAVLLTGAGIAMENKLPPNLTVANPKSHLPNV